MEELGTNGSPSSMKERVVEETERVGAGLILNDMEVVQSSTEHLPKL